MYKYDDDLIQYNEAFSIFNLKDYALARKKVTEISAQKPKPSTAGVDVTDLTISGSKSSSVPIRVYQKSNYQKDTPVILTIHGGGFVLGSINTDHKLSLEFVNELDVSVVSVDYRVSPESQFPDALYDCYAALEFIYSNAEEYGFDKDKVIVHGISAGGGLAAALCLLTRDLEGPKVYHQYLDLPELDDRMNSQSMLMYQNTPGWNTPNAELSWQYYLGDKYKTDDVSYYAAPSRVDDVSGLPTATITAYQYDPLCSEAIEYAEKLYSKAINTDLRVYSGVYHLAYLVEDSQIGMRHKHDKFSNLRKILSND